MDLEDGSSRRSGRACARCRQRHVKCDEALPGCQRCEKFGQPCPGYPTTDIFRDQGADLRLRYSGDGDRPRKRLAVDSGRRKRSNRGSEQNIIGTTVELPIPADEQGEMPHTIDGREESEDEIDGNVGVDSVGHALTQSPPLLENSSRLEHQDTEIDRHHGFTPSISTISDASAYISQQPKAVPPQAHETAFLLRHFAELIGPWMDLFDKEAYFASYIPVKSIESPLLRYCATAVAAKQLSRIKGRTAAPAKSFVGQAHTLMYDQSETVDWSYKSANLYNSAISYLQLYLRQAIPEGSVNPLYDAPMAAYLNKGTAAAETGEQRAPPQQSEQLTEERQQMSSPLLAELLCAVSILSVYEFLDHSGPDLLSHLDGIKSLLDHAPPIAHLDIRSNRLAFTARHSAFWNFVKEDYLAAFIHGCRTRIDADDIVLWRSAGLGLTSQGQLVTHGASENMVGLDIDPQSVDTISNALVWIMCRLMNLLAHDKQDVSSASGPPSSYFDPRIGQSGRSSSSQDVHSTWDVISQVLDSWFQDLPETFRLCLRVHSQSSTSIADRRLFEESYYSIPMCAATLQHYHFARILLLLNKPVSPVSQGSSMRSRLQAYRQVSKNVEKHAREICGIAISRPPSRVRIHMVQPLYAAGLCLEQSEERKMVLELLQDIEEELGWPTRYRIKALKDEWGWEEGSSIINVE